jgi:FkbM family methyltransferase
MQMKLTIGSKVFRGVAKLGRALPHFRGKYRALNSLYSSVAKNRGGTLVASISKPIPYEMSLNLDCAHERLAYCINGYEEDTVIFLSKLWDPSGCFLDIGANIGLISVPFAMMAKSKAGASSLAPTTVAFEPVSSNFASLKLNVELNALTKEVQLVNAGVGSEDKTVAIQVEGDKTEGSGTGTANILPEDSTYACERQTINVARIDSLIAQEKIPKQCSLIKIDTDGYDFFALQGAVDLLRNSRPIVFGEFSAHCMKWHGHTMNDVKQFADALNYEILIRQSPGTAWKFHRTTNFENFVQDAMMVPVEKLDSIRWCVSEE